jgi:hypothetical protein
MRQAFVDVLRSTVAPVRAYNTPLPPFSLRKESIMNVTYFQLTVTGYLRVLTTLEHLADKAQAFCKEKNIEESALLDAALYPDMFNCARQFELTAGKVARFTAFLAGKPDPTFPMNTPKSFAEAKKLASTVADYLKTFQESDFENSKDCEIRLPWMPNAAMTGEVFLLQDSLPDVYFHLTTAYDILRSKGVQVGKSDYLGKLDIK